MRYTRIHMKSGTLVFLSGLLLVLLPYFGIPSLWKHYSYLGIGIVLILLGYIVRRRQFLDEIDYGNGERGTDTFVETTKDLFESSKAD